MRTMVGGQLEEDVQGIYPQRRPLDNDSAQGGKANLHPIRTVVYNDIRERYGIMNRGTAAYLELSTHRSLNRSNTSGGTDGRSSKNRAKVLSLPSSTV